MQDKLPHLPVPIILNGIPRTYGGGKPSPEELELKKNRNSHSNYLQSASSSANAYWAKNLQVRHKAKSPVLPAGVPLLIRVEPGKDLDYLRSAFDFEIVAEHVDGIVIISCEDMELTKFAESAKGFLTKIKGSGNSGKIYEVFGPDNHEVRLNNILGGDLRRKWNAITDTQKNIVDISIECLGTICIPSRPKKTDTDKKTEGRYESRVEKWEVKKRAAQELLDDLQSKREDEILKFIDGYGGKVLSIIQDNVRAAILPDSFTVRAEINGLGLKDIALNYPYVFEIIEPDDTEETTSSTIDAFDDFEGLVLISPPDDSPSICIIDSGIQEGHILLQPGIDEKNSKCFIPEIAITDVADYVSNGGHGTRVAGAALYKESPPESGEYTLPFWIRNARVLNGQNQLHKNLLPPLLIKAIVDEYTALDPPTKIFNHSINTTTPFRPSRMSAWAAEIDNLSYAKDILFVQSAGNISMSDYNHSSLGVQQHIAAGRRYPDYLLEASSKISNPAQSMHALTVGSITYDFYTNGDKQTFGKKNEPSPFSRAGLGMWGAIKPDVVEYGGDWAFDNADPTSISNIDLAAPELIRSTLGVKGPAKSRDVTGTSYSAPKISHIAAAIQKALPGQSSQLYRSLIACSARWPEWAEGADNKAELIRMFGYGIPSIERAIYSTEKSITLISARQREIGGKEGHLYRIPIPVELRAPGNDFNVRIDISLAYVTPTRRTRRHNRNYFGTWVDWNVSKAGESLESIKSRLFVNQGAHEEDGDNIFSWNLREDDRWGEIEGLSRKNSSLQKDWAILPAHSLPEDFCIAVVGHAGYDSNSIDKAKYALSVSIEATEFELNLHELISTEIDLINEVDVEADVEVEIESNT